MSADFEGTDAPDLEFGNYNKMWGFGGNDSLTSNASFAYIYGGQGSDQAYYMGSGNSWIYGGGGADYLYGGNQNDRIFGGGGNDRIWGFDGNDKLKGGGGNDWMWGGLGKDTIWTGSGRDHVGFDSLPDGKPDRIKDFSPKKDFLNFVPSAYTVGLGLDTLPKSQFRYGKKAKDDDDHFGYDKKTGIVWYDPDGKGGESQMDVVKLDKGLSLTHVNIQF